MSYYKYELTIDKILEANIWNLADKKTNKERIDKVITEYPLGRFSADTLIHMVKCDEYVAEVEEELNYNAIGQVITYRYLYYKISKKMVKPIILCRRAKRELEEVAELEQGIIMIEVT
jgi:hypothetical protein